MSQQFLNKITSILVTLLVQAKDIDKENSAAKGFYLRKDKAIFSEILFSGNHDRLVPYVEETQAKVEQLARLINNNKTLLSYERIQLIEQQISAIHNAIQANAAQNKSSAQKLALLKKIKYKNTAKALFQPIQSLYQKQAETKEFERRLESMLAEKQLEFNNANNRNKDKFSNELLVLHQRLGRCRQALSKIERQIEMSEKR